MLHLEHVTYTPAPPGSKREETEPSVHTWISEGRREDSLFEADRSRAVLLPVQSGMRGGNSEVGCSPWGKGGAHDQKGKYRKGGRHCTSVLPPHRGGAVPSPMGMGRNGRTDLPRGSTKSSPPLSIVIFFGRSQLRNQSIGSKGASAPFSQVFKKICPQKTSV